MIRVASNQMRRPLAILLMLFFALGPLQGALEASDGARLPACCRRNGAHHCAMSENMRAAMEQATSSTPAFTAPSTCPAYPHFVLGTLASSPALVFSRIWVPILLEQTHSPLAVRADLLKVEIRTRSGRAPPASL